MAITIKEAVQRLLAVVALLQEAHPYKRFTLDGPDGRYAGRNRTRSDAAARSGCPRRRTIR